MIRSLLAAAAVAAAALGFAPIAIADPDPDPPCSEESSSCSDTCYERCCGDVYCRTSSQLSCLTNCLKNC